MLNFSLATTPVYDTFWRFAAERQEVFFQRQKNAEASIWTLDSILQEYKFTNAYRASDRVSQYLIKNVIYKGNQSLEEIFFRILVFKTFNKIETWELLETQLGSIEWRSYDFSIYDKILSTAINSRCAIYSAAYIMASGKTAFGHARKHRNHLMLIEKMMRERLYDRIHSAKSMEEVFLTLSQQPTIGSFLAYQYTVDLNYSSITEFSENDFVMPGPGAIRGIQKCFSDIGHYSLTDIIRYVTSQQEEEFDKRGIKFKNLWGRPLHLIDIQNLFCETDKYARVRHPEFNTKHSRTRIKQRFRPNTHPIMYWYPPKWKINDRINLS
jgi:hypothetical protein